MNTKYVRRIKSKEKAVRTGEKAKALPFVMGASAYAVEHGFYKLMIYTYEDITDEQLQILRSL